MVHNSFRITRLLSWRSLRWALTIPTLPLVWWACTSHPLSPVPPQAEIVTNLFIPVSPIRQLDMIFMIDNSPSMAPKQQKLKDNFATLLNALKDPDGILPDLRVAIIDSDLGTKGEQGLGGNCGPNVSNGQNAFGDAGKFRMLNTTAANPTPCGANADALWLEYKAGKAVNYNGDINAVFACLAGNVGTNGCGFEHQLQAFEFALRKDLLRDTPDAPLYVAQQLMIRSSAYLALVFLSDEDDCSAAINDGLFSSGLQSTLGGESASLRCSTRAHQCGVNKLAATTPPGYPTTLAYTHPFMDCSARTDSCAVAVNTSVDTSVPTDCSPLRDIHDLATQIKQVKVAQGQNPDEQILVAGIFGWPRKGDEATAQYKIDKLYNQNPQAPGAVWDYWPVCYDPAHLLGNNDPTTPAGYAASVGFGATGGLRMSAFVDEFNQNGVNNGLKYSICEPDFKAALGDIGTRIAAKLQNLCVQYKLLDSDTGTPGVQPDCYVAYSRPDPTTGVYTEDPSPMPRCDPNLSDTTQQSYPCWKLVYDPIDKCAGDKGAGIGQLVNVVRQPGEGPLLAGTKVDMSCRTCAAGSILDPNNKACNY